MASLSECSMREYVVRKYPRDQEQALIYHSGWCILGDMEEVTGTPAMVLSRVPGIQYHSKTHTTLVQSGASLEQDVGRLVMYMYKLPCTCKVTISDTASGTYVHTLYIHVGDNLIGVPPWCIYLHELIPY